MSAWIVSKAHIDALVTGLVRSEIAAPTGLTPDQLGQTLWEENYTSIRARYGDEDSAPPYTHTVLDLPPVVLLKQVHCYDYQSCEHGGWETSEAHAWITALDELLSRSVRTPSPAYSDAPWGI